MKRRRALEDEVASHILAIGKIEEHLGPRGPYFCIGSQTIAYVAAPGLLEVRLGRSGVEELRPELETSDRTIVRRRGSSWVGIRYASRSDLALIVAVVSRAAESSSGKGSRLSQ